MAESFPDIVASAEIALMLDVSNARVTQLSHRDDFPTPVATLRVGRIWLTSEIRQWMRDDGRD